MKNRYNRKRFLIEDYSAENKNKTILSFNSYNNKVPSDYHCTELYGHWIDFPEILAKAEIQITRGIYALYATRKITKEDDGFYYGKLGLIYLAALLIWYVDNMNFSAEERNNNNHSLHKLLTNFKQFLLHLNNKNVQWFTATLDMPNKFIKETYTYLYKYADWIYSFKAQYPEGEPYLNRWANAIVSMFTQVLYNQKIKDYIQNRSLDIEKHKTFVKMFVYDVFQICLSMIFNRGNAIYNDWYNQPNWSETACSTAYVNKICNNLYSDIDNFLKALKNDILSHATI